MAKVFGGAALAADIAAPEALAFGAADVGALGAEAGTEAAIGGDVLAGGEVAAAAAEPTAEVGLEALNTQFGTFSPEVFAANTADVAAGGLGADVGAADLAAGGSGVLDTAGGDFFGGPSGDLFSGVQQPSLFDPNAIDPTTFSGPTQAPAGEGSWMQAPGGENITGQGFGAAGDQTGGPMVSSSSEGGGIVDTGAPLQGGATGANQPLGNLLTGTPGYSTQEGFLSGAGPVGPSNTLGGGSSLGDLSNLSGGNVTNLATTPASFSPNNYVAGEFSQLPNQTVATPSDFLAVQESPPIQPTSVATTPATFDPVTRGITPLTTQPTVSDTGVITPAGAPATAPSLPPAQNVPTVGPAATPANTNPIPTAPAAANAPSSPAAVANAPAAAAGGTDALTALRMGAAGASIISSGINIANALNQPSYTALQPSYYPGSPFNPQPNAPGFSVDNTTGGGLTGGLAASRLTNGLVAGQSAQQLALSGLISPERATRLQQDYQGITEQYAQQKGVDPRTLSPAVQRVIAARALADTGLGGR